MTEEERAATPCIVALCKCGCERIVYVRVNDGTLTADERKEVAQIVADGHAVKTITVAEVRKAKLFCATHDKPEPARGEA